MQKVRPQNETKRDRNLFCAFLLALFCLYLLWAIVVPTSGAPDEKDRLLLSDNKIVGIVDLRYRLNDFLKDFGNCGYSVRPSERRKGYATEILRQICLVAKEHGLKQLQLSVEKDNVASIKTIEKNGGEFSRSFIFENEEAYVYLLRL